MYGFSMILQRNCYYFLEQNFIAYRVAVGIRQATGWTDGVRFPAGETFFCTPQRSEWLWGPFSLVPNGYRGFFPQGDGGRDVNLTAHLHLVPRLRTVELYLHSLIRLHGVVLNKLSTGTT
jgi:hypothetical protein